MKNGAILFAQNNSVIDYIEIATFAAERIKKFLDIPVSIITDDKSSILDRSVFDKVIEIKKEDATSRLFYDGTLSSKHVEWNNVSRSKVYQLTPYDRTLVLDSDYIISSNRLLQAFDRETLFQIYHNSFDICNWRDNKVFSRINQYSIPFYWATVFCFHKHPVIESFFNLISYIKENWTYFRVLYSIESPLFRNDFAFSIAIHIMNGKTNGEFATELPGKMVYSLDHDFLIDMNEDSMSFLIQKQNYLGEYLAAKVSGLDVHVMNKMSLSRYISGGSGV